MTRHNERKIFNERSTKTIPNYFILSQAIVSERLDISCFQIYKFLVAATRKYENYKIKNND